jgi:hypothetical protein
MSLDCRPSGAAEQLRLKYHRVTFSINHPGSENYQRNSDGGVGFRLILLSVFALQLGFATWPHAAQSCELPQSVFRVAWRFRYVTVAPVGSGSVHNMKYKHRITIFLEWLY